MLPGFEFMERLVAGQGTCCKERPVPLSKHERAKIACELIGKVLGVAEAEDLGRRLMSENPGGESDRTAMRFQVARRNIDNEPFDFA